MERPIPKPGERYTDIKGKPYQILCVANYVRTKEKMVVYQGLYGDFECFVRPLGMFMEEVDTIKYPNAAQTYYFERIDAKKAGTIRRQTEPEVNDVQPHKEALAKEYPQADPALLQFLDADTLEQKYQIIKNLGASITDRLIDDFAVTLDLVIPDGNVDIRYQQLLSSIRTMQKFETNRFRR